ncbi:MAG: HD domain-containing protein [Deltaproteobacteria bacterium]|nr:HD domain-containing protein [Deltaproteobacteria bacterium]
MKIFFSKYISKSAAFSHIGHSVSDIGTGTGELPVAQREVTAALTGLLTTLHDKVAPHYYSRTIVLELLAALEQKSPFTAQHSMGVATVARILARALGLDVIKVERISMAALLHDVGKLVIPNRILEKKHVLSETERLYIQTHALFTNIILSAFPTFDTIRDIAALHHEHLNGTGYPYGCTAAGLSLETRIVTVADIFMALTEERPYRKSMSNSAALHKLNTLASEGIVDNRVVNCAEEKLLVFDRSSSVWYPSRVSISIALNTDAPQYR